jgi:protein-tyrosine kinase
VSEQNDRLALIARAGKRLRGSQESAPLPTQSASEAIGPEIASAIRTPVVETSQRSGHPPSRQASANPPDHNLKLVAEGPFPVKLHYARLRQEGILTPDNMRSSLGFENRAIKRKLLSAIGSNRKQGKSANLVMITSPRPADGKTFSSMNLAVSLATERDASVLLVDADIVRRKLSTFFDPSKGFGLTDLLKGECNDIADTIHPCTDLPNLSVMFAGQYEEHAPELVASRRMGEICAELSRRYSDGLVILDTPPVLASPETVGLASFVDQIVMVVASGQTKRDHLQAALENVSACPNLTLLLNQAPDWNKFEGDTYYYYGYEDRAQGGEQSEAVLRP